MHACTRYAWSDCAWRSWGVHDVTLHAWFGPFILDLCHVILDHHVPGSVHFLPVVACLLLFHGQVLDTHVAT